VSSGNPARPEVRWPGGEITGTTRLYLHLAHPSTHVRTPQIMNTALARRGIDVVAASADVAPMDVGQFMRGVRGWRNLAGLGVTMPHKEALIAHVDELTGQAALIGAVNVIRREPDGRLVATNTDGRGFVVGLRNVGQKLAGRRVLLAGVGGAGRAIAFAAAEAGVANLTLANRTAAKAERLATEITASYPAVSVSAGPPDPAGHEVVINATSLGMHRDDPLPVPAERLEPGTLVCDIVMSPPRTPLLLEASARGCIAHPGLPMLVGQVDLVLQFLGLIPSSPPDVPAPPRRPPGPERPL
jgi:shikimate dehydrogenase